jgi:Xaa-Pro aminopeptidase
MKNVYSKRISALQSALTKQKLDGLLVVTIEDNNKNVRYLTGFGGTTGALLVTTKTAILVVDPRYTLRAVKEAQGVQVIEIPKDIKKKGDFISYVDATLIFAKFPKTARLGFEGARISHAMAKAWEKHFTQPLVPVTGMVEKLRQVKDVDELRKIARAGKLTSEVFVQVSKKIRPGQTEREVAEMLDSELRESGAQKNSFDTIVASGPNSASPHHETSMRKLRAGEPVVLDFGGVFDDGYCSDITRTIFVGGKKPNSELAKIYQVVLRANKKAFASLTSGMLWKEYDASARTYIEEHGYGEYFTHGLGHSVGLEAHDPYDYVHDVFLPGTVMSNEPGIYIPDLGGVRIENDVVVTTTGARNLTPAPYLSL